MKISKKLAALWGKLHREKPQPKIDVDVNAGVPSDLAVIPLTGELVPAFIEHNRNTVYSFMLKRISKAIRANADIMYMFWPQDKAEPVRIRKQNFEGALNELKSHFIKIEDYESARKCSNLINRHIVNLLLDST